MRSVLRRTRLPWAPNDEGVVPSVLVEVVNEGEEIIGVVNGIKLLYRLIPVFLREPWACIPIGTRSNIHRAIVVEVTVIRAFDEEVRTQLLGVPRNELAILDICCREAHGGDDEC